MSVAEKLAFGLCAIRVPFAERKRRIRDIARLVGLGDYLNVRPGELSGGEQQRVALARTLVSQPRILLMDEPLSNLDAALGRRLRGEILRLHAELGFTLVYVTHSVSEAQEIGLRTIELSVTAATVRQKSGVLGIGAGRPLDKEDGAAVGLLWGRSRLP